MEKKYEAVSYYLQQGFNIQYRSNSANRQGCSLLSLFASVFGGAGILYSTVVKITLVHIIHHLLDGNNNL